MVKYVRYDGLASSYLVVAWDEDKSPTTKRWITVLFQYAFDKGVVVALPNRLFELLNLAGHVGLPETLTEVEKP